jgi:hypothetical protein
MLPIKSADPIVRIFAVILWSNTKSIEAMGMLGQEEWRVGCRWWFGSSDAAEPVTRRHNCTFLGARASLRSARAILALKLGLRWSC